MISFKTAVRLAEVRQAERELKLQYFLLLVVFGLYLVSGNL